MTRVIACSVSRFAIAASTAGLAGGVGRPRRETEAKDRREGGGSEKVAHESSVGVEEGARAARG